MVIPIAILVLVLLSAGLVFVATRPNSFRVERTAQIHAPQQVVFAIINDLRQWARWSPFDKRDPQMHKELSGPDTGPGASYSWNGNKDVGEGRMTIVDSKPGESVSMKLEFTRPFKAKNDVTFALVPNDDGTRVSWILDGKNNFMAKFFSLLINMDTMIGKDFEEGLAKLNSIAQSDAEGTN